MDFELPRRHHGHTLDLLDPGMACKRLGQARGEILIQKTESIRHPGQILHFSQEFRPLLTRRRRAADAREGHGVAVLVTDLVPSQLTHGQHGEQKKAQPQEGQQNREAVTGQSAAKRDLPGLVGLLRFRLFAFAHRASLTRDAVRQSGITKSRFPAPTPR